MMHSSNCSESIKNILIVYFVKDLLEDVDYKSNDICVTKMLGIATIYHG